MAPGEPRVPLHRNPFLWAFLIGIATLTALRPLLRHIPEPPPVVGDVPAFALVDQDGRRFGREQLLGRVTIANLFCTRCDAANPQIMNALRRIEDAYKDRGIDRIGLLSISIDPAVDTPERLRDYARTIGAEPRRWTLLTGDAGAAKDLAVNLFENAGAQARPLVIIDQQARIRGWYAADEMGLDEVYNRAQHVLAQNPARGR